jgi:hypothetical protein
LWARLWTIWTKPENLRKVGVKKLIRLLGFVSLTFWILLTVVVITFVVDREQNPGRKSISDVDIALYWKITIVMVGIFVGSRFLKADSDQEA